MEGKLEKMRKFLKTRANQDWKFQNPKRIENLNFQNSYLATKYFNFESMFENSIKSLILSNFPQVFTILTIFKFSHFQKFKFPPKLNQNFNASVGHHLKFIHIFTYKVKKNEKSWKTKNIFNENFFLELKRKKTFEKRKNINEISSE